MKVHIFLFRYCNSNNLMGQFITAGYKLFDGFLNFKLYFKFQEDEQMQKTEINCDIIT